MTLKHPALVITEEVRKKKSGKRSINAAFFYKKSMKMSFQLFSYFVCNPIQPVAASRVS